MGEIQDSNFSNYFVVESPGKDLKVQPGTDLKRAAGDQYSKASGSVQPGTDLKVAFKYMPPVDKKLTFGDMTLDLLSGIGQWITCKVKGTLTGGYAPPGEPPTQEIN